MINFENISKENTKYKTQTGHKFSITHVEYLPLVVQDQEKQMICKIYQTINLILIKFLYLHKTHLNF